MSPLTPELEQLIQARLRYYRDIGVYDFYRRGEPDPAALGTGAMPEARAVAAEPIMESSPIADPPAAPAPTSNSQLDLEPVIPPRKPVTPPPALVPEIVPAAKRPAALEAIRNEIGDCTRCPLAFQGRHTIVFADGDPNARLMFVGEGPGADEDAQGLPFVGRAGQLLNNMINAMGLQREQVYIANVVKCRPPGNRDPETDEVQACRPYLDRQIQLVRPRLIVALGRIAAQRLLSTDAPLSKLRGPLYEYGSDHTPVLITYHPAYLLRSPGEKAKSWADLKRVHQFLAA